MKFLELFAGTHVMADTFKAHGWETYTVDWDPETDADLHADIGKLSLTDIKELCDGFPDVIWASPDCFPAGTPVWTSTGYKNIEHIQSGEYVMTHTGRYKMVYNTVHHENDKLIRIRIAGHEPLLCTPNHRFYARKKNSYSTRKGGKSHRESFLSDPEWVEAKDLSTEYRVGIPINQDAIVPPGPTGHEELTKNPLFWWLVGLYIADGSISKTTVTICSEKSTDERAIISSALTELGIKFSERDCRTAHHHEIHNKELCDFLLQFGKGAANKTATAAIVSLPKEHLKQFVDGYLWGDGHMDRSTKNPQWKFTTVSRNLAYSMQLCILKAYGRYTTITIRPKEKQCSVIEGREVNVHDSYVCGFYIDDSNRFQYTIEDGFAWVNVREVSDTNEVADTYCLSVEDDESFTVLNTAVHNCTTYSVAAISKHRRQEGDDLVPVSDYAKQCDDINRHVVALIIACKVMKEDKEHKPFYYFIENPRGGMRKMPWLEGIPRYTVTYCQYGETRQKPTDIWTNHPFPNFKPPCKPGAPCHVRAPRGSKTGTQGIKGKLNRARIPQKLCEHIVEICEEE